MFRELKKALPTFKKASHLFKPKTKNKATASSPKKKEEKVSFLQLIRYQLFNFTISLRSGISILIISTTTLAIILLTFVFYNAAERVALQFGNRNIENVQAHTTTVINNYFRTAEQQLLNSYFTFLQFFQKDGDAVKISYKKISEYSEGTAEYTALHQENTAFFNPVAKVSRNFANVETTIGLSHNIQDILEDLLNRTKNIASMYVGLEDSGEFVMAKHMPDGSISIKQVHQTKDEVITYWHHRNPEYYFDFPAEISTKIDDGYDPRERGWYRNTISSSISNLYRTSTWSEPYVFASDKKIGITISKKITYEGKNIGVFAIDLPLEAISKFISDFDLIKNQNGLIFLSSAKEVILAISEKNRENDENAIIRNRLFIEVQRINGVPTIEPIKVYEAGNPLIRGVIFSRSQFFDYKNFFKNSNITSANLERLLFSFYAVKQSDYLNSLSTKLYDKTAELIINFFAISDINKNLIFSKTKMQNKYGLFEIENELFLTHTRVIQPSSWFPITMGVVIPYQMIAGPLRASLQLILATTIIIFIICIFVAIAIAKRISAPLIKISSDMNKIRNFQLQTDVSNKKQPFTELKNMQDSFDNMKQGLLSFKKFVPTEIVSHLVQQGIEADVSGKNTEITTLFSDITQFTRLTEQTKSDQLIKQLHQYFNLVSRTIDYHRGTLDKYIGDSVMAIWGAPVAMENHAIKACFAALNCQEVIDTLNENFLKKNLHTLETRIGINTGEAIVGNIGSDARLNYTAIGDSVNLASRLESINKIYGTRIIISHSTYILAKDFVEVRPLDKVAVYGKEIIVPIYELVAKKDEINEQQKRIISMSEQAFHFIDTKRWSSAIRELRAIKSFYPNDKTADILIERCYLYIENADEKRKITFALNAATK